MASRPIIDSLVDHVTGARWQDLDASARTRARVFLLDSLGVGIAGSSGAAVAPLIATLGGWGSGDEATVWVSGERLPAGLAAIANAYQLHCLEYDCVHEGAVVHPMATVLSALLAGAERLAARGRPVPGRDFLLALCIGIDVATLLGLAATGPVRFFRPATAGGFGAAAALARLAGLDAEAVRNALGAVYAQTSGTLQPHVEGSPMLGMQVGFNARAALHAVDLAAAGIPAPHDVIDGPYGYLRLFENGAFDTGRIEALIGREWQVTRLSHKPFPSGRLTHGVVDALRRLQAAHGFRRGDIVAVEGRVPPLVMRLVGRPDIPDPSPNYAKLCLAFVAATWIRHGQADVPEFRDPAVLGDPAIHALARSVRLTQDDNPDPNALDPQWFAVTLADGTRHEMRLDHVWGHPEAPLTEEENRAKFRRCTGWARLPMPPAQAAALEAAVDGLEEAPDAAALARLTVVAAGEGEGR